MKRVLMSVIIFTVVLCASCIGMIDPGDRNGSGTESKAESKTEYSEAEASAAEESRPYSGFVFKTKDRDGKAWDQTVFTGNTLTMINFWEPWCGPCVREMPDLQKLSEDYKEQGLLILGVYSTTDMEEDVDLILDTVGVTYPILHYTAVFDRFETGYVPTTVFFDAEGNVLGEPYVGSRSYSDWAEIVERLLDGGGNE